MKFEEKDSIHIPAVEKCFIYFLLDNGDVVYVGQSKNRYSYERPFNHTKDKKFTDVRIIFCEANNIDELEGYYINKYSPIYNRKMNQVYLTSFRKIRINLKIRLINYPKSGIRIEQLHNIARENNICVIKNDKLNFFGIHKSDENTFMNILINYYGGVL